MIVFETISVLESLSLAIFLEILLRVFLILNDFAIFLGNFMADKAQCGV